MRRYLIGMDAETGTWEVYSASLDRYGSICGGTLVASLGTFDKAMSLICRREYEERREKESEAGNG